MNALGEKISALIEAQGPISVAQFMQMANHDYYGKGDVFGLKGDFITAPEISQMFGEMLGAWIVQCWAEQEKPKHFHLVEFGPGRGTLMADVLRTAKKVMPDFDPDVVLVESSAVLKNYQTIKLEGSRVRWLTHFDESLQQLPLFVLANEFFDALPIRQYVKTEKGWCERMVTTRAGHLAFALAPIASGMERAGEIGAVYEVCPAGTALMEEVAGVIAERGGAGLIVDYGHGGGLGDTLQAVGAHKFADVLERPGEVDLSAHVDFAALADAAKSGGAEVWGPREQGAFLRVLGIGERAQRLQEKNPEEAGTFRAALDRLTRDTQMGKLFKAMAIMPPNTERPAGF